MHKIGSNLSEILDPCIDEYLESESYMQICEENEILDDCIPNSFFPEQDLQPWDISTSKLAENGFGCENGFCGCDA